MPLAAAIGSAPPSPQLPSQPWLALARRWSARGTVFLSNMRMVFVADKADASGLQVGLGQLCRLPAVGVLPPQRRPAA